VLASRTELRRKRWFAAQLSNDGRIAKRIESGDRVSVGDQIGLGEIVEARSRRPAILPHGEFAASIQFAIL
jgi:hypothetical protein